MPGINTIFYIAGVGIILAMINVVLNQANKSDWAQWVNLIGAIIVIYMIAGFLQDLFFKLQTIFRF